MVDKKVEKCDCDKNCKCGCQEGKECSCDAKCKCECFSNKEGCCCKKKVFKVLGLLIVFLAGMGFGELLDCGGCPVKAPRPVAPMSFNHRTPTYHDTQGGNVIIINTDGHHDEFKMDKDCPLKREMMKKRHDRHFDREDKYENVKERRPMRSGAAVK